MSLDYLFSPPSPTDFLYCREHEHDREPSGSFQKLEVFDEVPQLPSAYRETVNMLIGRIDESPTKAVMKLERRQLGPFDPATDHEETQCARERAEEILASEPAEPSGPVGADQAALRLADRCDSPADGRCHIRVPGSEHARGRRRLSGLRWLLALTLAAVSLACSRSDGRCPDCNVILIVVDTLSADHMSLYGYPRSTTPRLDARFLDLVIFEEAISQSTYTTASMGSIMTSLYPSRHGVGSHNNVHRSLPPEATTLAGILRSRGYDTVAFNANPLISQRRGFDTGFSDYQTLCFEARSLGAWPNCVSESAQTWLSERESDAPFFLYLHYMDVHSPYIQTEGYKDSFYGKGPSLNGQQLRRTSVLSAYCFKGLDTSHADVDYYASRYDDGVLYIDHVLDDLLSWLDTSEVSGTTPENTVVVITSDHGEAFQDLGTFCHGGPPIEAQIHVPLIFRHPGFRSGLVGQNVETIDIAPTILDFLELDSTQHVFDGTSLLPDLMGIERPARFVYSEVPQSGVDVDDWAIVSRAVKWKDTKLLQLAASGSIRLLRDSDAERGFDGPGATELERKLYEELAERVRQLGTPASREGAADFSVSPEIADALRAFGYLEETDPAAERTVD